MSNPTSLELIHAYRHLYRGLLHAVQYSMPARFVARNNLRDAFRKGDPSTFNKEKIGRTIEFLALAAQENGLEHKLVQNLLHAKYWRRYKYTGQSQKKNPTMDQMRQTSTIHYDMTLAMLNDSMGLCLR